MQVLVQLGVRMCTRPAALASVENWTEDIQGGLTDAEKRRNVIELAFGGSEDRLEEFVRVIREEIPDGTAVILRGSAVTGRRWKDDAPFDADGPGTSDLDIAPALIPLRETLRT